MNNIWLMLFLHSLRDSKLILGVRVGAQMFYSQGTFTHNLKPAAQIASV